MRPFSILARARTPDGEEIMLRCRDGVYDIVVGGIDLMTSRMHGSEAALARIGCAALARARSPAVLIGGLGMGYTLRAALDLLPASARVEVAEALSVVVQWNREVLAPLAGRPLDDRRVELREADVLHVLATAGRPYDAILLDVDNGPNDLTLRSNREIYTAHGLQLIRSRLTPGGAVAVWSTYQDPGFERRLRLAGFDARTERASSRDGGRGSRHSIFVGTRPSRPS